MEIVNKTYEERVAEYEALPKLSDKDHIKNLIEENGELRNERNNLFIKCHDLQEVLSNASWLIEYLHGLTVVPDNEMENYGNHYMNITSEINKHSK